MTPPSAHDDGCASDRPGEHRPSACLRAWLHRPDRRPERDAHEQDEEGLGHDGALEVDAVGAEQDDRRRRDRWPGRSRHATDRHVEDNPSTDAEQVLQ